MTVKRSVTEQQKEVVRGVELDDSGFLDDYEEGIQIPEFLKKKEEFIPEIGDEFEQAILNNTPGNTEIEKQNHLNELERACQNWDEEEWHRVLYHASSRLMCDELKRRTSVFEDYMMNTRKNLDLLTSQKL